MFKARHKTSMSLIFALLISALSSPAYAVCENGMKESLISPAEIEYGTITHQIYNKSLASQERVVPSIWQAMTQVEADKLPKQSTYQHLVYVPERLNITLIDLPVGEVSEFDYVYWPDGTVATREIEAPIPRTVNNYELLEPVKTELVETAFTRADPVVLPDGRLNVMISPAHNIPIIVRGHIVEVKETYVKSRTPAKYQLSFCE